MRCGRGAARAGCGSPGEPGDQFFVAQRHAATLGDPAWSAEAVAVAGALLDRVERLGPPGRRLVMQLMCARTKVPLSVAVSAAEAVLTPTGRQLARRPRP